MLVTLASVLLLAASPVRVESEECPSGAEVEQMLAGMLPSPPATAKPDVARVTKRTLGLRIELLQPDGSMIAERSLDREGSCRELAELAAVVIASWESDVHPEFMRPHAEPMPVTSVELPAAQRPRPVAYDLAFGASLSHADSLAAGGVLTVTWIPRGTGPGVRLLGTVDGERTIDLDLGRAHWRRWAGSAELDWRVSRIPLDLHGGLALGWLTARGLGFSETQSAVSFSPAVTLGVRVAWWVTERLAFWLDLTGLYWTRSQKIYAEPPMIERALPRLQGIASAGLAFGRVANGR